MTTLKKIGNDYIVTINGERKIANSLDKAFDLLVPYYFQYGITHIFSHREVKHG